MQTQRVIHPCAIVRVTSGVKGRSQNREGKGREEGFEKRFDRSGHNGVLIYFAERGQLHERICAGVGLSFNIGGALGGLLSDSGHRLLPCRAGVGHRFAKAIFASTHFHTPRAHFWPAIDTWKAILMTKPFSALLAAVLCASTSPMAAAQTVSDAARPMPGWVHEVDPPVSDIEPVGIDPR